MALDDALLLGDDDVRRLPSTVAVDAARAALLAAYRGWLIGAPRVAVPAGDGELVFTVGGYGTGSGPVGFRVYGIGDDPVEQVTLVWNRSGRLAAVVAGGELGARRTGAIGAVAVDLLSRSDNGVVGLVGAGVQAWTQLWALQAVRPLGAVRVFSRHPQGREAFAERAREELAVSVRPVPTAQEAVTDADIVVLATRSQSPVIDPAWVNPGRTSPQSVPRRRRRMSALSRFQPGRRLSRRTPPHRLLHTASHASQIASSRISGRSRLVTHRAGPQRTTSPFSCPLASLGPRWCSRRAVLEAQRRDRS